MLQNHGPSRGGDMHPLRVEIPPRFRSPAAGA